MIKDLIDLVGGLPNVLRGTVEGLIFSAWIAVCYFAVCAAVPFN